MNIKKYLPFIAIGVGILFFVVVVFVIRKINQPVADVNTIDETVADLPSDQKPTVALVPTPDGHYLILKVEQIDKVKNASSMDYELLWKADNAGNETTQGTSSTVKLGGQSSYNNDLLLGSESNGKFRYDQGVENGTITLRFRNSDGKLLGKVVSDFHLQTETTNLSSVDGKLKYTLDKVAAGVWFVTMQSFGKPSSNVVTFSDGYSVFASDGKPHAGSAS